PLSPPTVTSFLPGICSNITSAASRSAVPLATNTSAFTISPFRFSTSRFPGCDPFLPSAAARCGSNTASAAVALLFRWFVGLNADDPGWDATVFTKNRDRLLQAEVAKEFSAEVVAQAGAKGLTSDEHFTVDGTLLEAWASQKSYQAREGKQPPPPDDPGNPTVNFRGERRSNQTHASKTDPEAQMARKGEGKESKLSYSGNLLVENRNGVIVNAEVFVANGTAERDAALVMLERIPGKKQVTVGGDKGFDTRDFVAECRHLGVTPHVAQNMQRNGGS